MNYKIISIKHTGTKGTKGTDRIDGRYQKRIGRIVDVNLKNIKIDTPWIINYVTDENGNDYSGYCLVTSLIQNITHVGDDKIYVTTINSVFELLKEN